MKRKTIFFLLFFTLLVILINNSEAKYDRNMSGYFFIFETPTNYSISENWNSWDDSNIGTTTYIYNKSFLIKDNKTGYGKYYCKYPPTFDNINYCGAKYNITNNTRNQFTIGISVKVIIEPFNSDPAMFFGLGLNSSLYSGYSFLYQSKSPTVKNWTEYRIMILNDTSSLTLPNIYKNSYVISDTSIEASIYGGWNNFTITYNETGDNAFRIYRNDTQFSYITKNSTITNINDLTYLQFGIQSYHIFSGTGPERGGFNVSNIYYCSRINCTAIPYIINHSIYVNSSQLMTANFYENRFYEGTILNLTVTVKHDTNYTLSWCNISIVPPNGSTSYINNVNMTNDTSISGVGLSLFDVTTGYRWIYSSLKLDDAGMFYYNVTCGDIDGDQSETYYNNIESIEITSSDPRVYPPPAAVVSMPPVVEKRLCSINVSPAEVKFTRYVDDVNFTLKNNDEFFWNPTIYYDESIMQLYYEEGTMLATNDIMQIEAMTSKIINGTLLSNIVIKSDDCIDVNIPVSIINTDTKTFSFCTDSWSCAYNDVKGISMEKLWNFKGFNLYTGYIFITVFLIIGILVIKYGNLIIPLEILIALLFGIIINALIYILIILKIQ